MITKLNYKDKTIKSYAIRKLTPFECFRLMGVRDAVIHIMQTTVKSVKKRIMKVFKSEYLNEDSRINYDDEVRKLREQGIEPKVYHDEEKEIRVVGIKRKTDHGSMWDIFEEEDYPADAEKSFDEVWELAAEDAPEVTPEPYSTFNFEAEADIAEESEHDYTRWLLFKGEGEYIKKEVSEGTDDMLISASQQYKQAGNSIVVDVLKAIYENLWYPPMPKKKQQLSLFDTFFAEDVLPDLPQPSPLTPSTEGERYVTDSQGVKRLISPLLREGQGGGALILTTFSGYDSQLMAADALRESHPDFQWQCVGWSDIDKYACQMHDLVFPQYADKALGDITKIDWHKVKDSLNGREIDLFTYSSPCQDISQAGKQMGLKEGSGSRSALLWNVSDAVEILRPKYLLQENVAALVSEKFIGDFRLWLKRLESLGYVNFWHVLNAKDYGVPQNRERVFCLSMRRDVAFNYQWPEPIKMEKRLEDILEEEVDERYFLKDEAVSKFLRANDKDSAVFVQFPLPPRHEDAMFLKTWLQGWMLAGNMWELPPTELEAVLTNETFRSSLADDYREWKYNNKFPNDSFRELYEHNLKPHD